MSFDSSLVLPMVVGKTKEWEDLMGKINSGDKLNSHYKLKSGDGNLFAGYRGLNTYLTYWHAKIYNFYAISSYFLEGHENYLYFYLSFFQMHFPYKCGTV